MVLVVVFIAFTGSCEPASRYQTLSLDCDDVILAFLLTLHVPRFPFQFQRPPMPDLGFGSLGTQGKPALGKGRT